MALLKGLFVSFKQLLEDTAIPFSNIVGFASDNCATMIGAQSGFQARLKKEIPSLFVLGCVCHSFALCANAATRRLPSWLEAFVKNVFFYFSRSSKRNVQFRLIQEVVKVHSHRVFKLSETRWLSREAVIERKLEQWDALKLFFQSESPTDKVDGAGLIYQTMNTIGTKHMLLFVGHILAKVNCMNIEFQSEHYRLHKLHSSVIDEYRHLLSLFIKSDVLNTRSLADIDPNDPSIVKQMNTINLGGRCEALLLRQPLGDKENQFRGDALAFLKELCTQIRMRFPLSENGVLAQLKLMDPNAAFDVNKPSIIPLAVNFPTAVPENLLDKLSDEWYELPSFRGSLEHLINKEPPAFWFALKEIKDGNNKVKFKTLAQLMCTLAVLPHSSACVERVFFAAEHC